MTDIDIKLLNLMLKGVKNIHYKNKTHKLLGRGGEGNVYTFDKMAIKVYSSTNADAILNELYIIDSLKSNPKIKSHISNVLDCGSNTQYTTDIMYCFMELYDGDLDRWVMNSLYNPILEQEWMSMIFQVVYTFTIINESGVLHNDSKPKNIFYLDKKDTTIHSYKWDNKTFEIPIRYRFVIGDFGHSLIEESIDGLNKTYLLGSTGSGDLIFDLINRSDMFELSRILYRARVNIILKTYDMAEMDEMISSIQDLEFKNKIKCVDESIKKKFENSPVKTNLDRIVNRAHIYELLEFGYISDSMLESKANIVFPSTKVQNILSDIMNMNINLSSLFDFFYKP